MDRMHTWQMFSFLLILWKDFKITAISLIFSFQRAVKAWIIANCLDFNLNLFKWLILHLVEWFGSKIWVCKVFICSPFRETEATDIVWTALYESTIAHRDQSIKITNRNTWAIAVHIQIHKLKGLSPLELSQHIWWNEGHRSHSTWSWG